MAKTDTITIPASVQHEVFSALCDERPCRGDYRYDGVEIFLEGDTVELYGGNRRARSILAERARRLADHKQLGGDRITPRQADYLRALIHRDPGEASNIGLRADAVDGLTKKAASRYIEQMRALTED